MSSDTPPAAAAATSASAKFPKETGDATPLAEVGATLSTVAAATTPASHNSNNSKPPSAMDFEPPLACVRRILKHALPASTNVGKDASAAFARASGIFIVYLTACAHDFARESKRQTIQANDVLAAVRELEFDFTAEMEAFLENYRKQEKDKRDAKKAAKSEQQQPPDGDDAAHTKGMNEHDFDQNDTSEQSDTPEKKDLDPSTADPDEKKRPATNSTDEEPEAKRLKPTEEN